VADLQPAPEPRHAIGRSRPLAQANPLLPGNGRQAADGLGLRPGGIYILLSREKFMAVQKNFFSRLWEALLQMGAYDILKYLVLLGVALFVAAIWPQFKNLPTDWWGILAVGVSTSICFVILLLLQRTSKVDQHPTTVGEVEQIPPWAGYESEEAWHQAIDNQNRLIDIGRTVDNLFSPVQIDAFRLAKDIRDFLGEMGKRPDTDWAGVSTEGRVLEKLRERWRLQSPYENRMANGFNLRFASRLRDVMLRLGEQGIERSVILGPYIDTENDEEQIEHAARDLEQLAVLLNAGWVEDPDKDTRTKLGQLSADSYKKLFSVDAALTEWIGKKERPRPVL
jgi:hypothetical protein